MKNRVILFILMFLFVGIIPPASAEDLGQQDKKISANKSHQFFTDLEKAKSQEEVKELIRRYASDPEIFPPEQSYSISLDSIEFILTKEDNKAALDLMKFLPSDKKEDVYRVYALYVKSKVTAMCYSPARFCFHRMALSDDKKICISAFDSCMYYIPTSGVIFQETIMDKKLRYFVVGRGKIRDGKFIPTFPKGTKITFGHSGWPYSDRYYIEIYFPYDSKDISYLD